MAAAESEITSLRIVKREVRRYAFDSLADEVLSKAFALAKSAIILIENDHGEEALGLCRSIVECALNLRWITSDRTLIQERSLRFVWFGHTIKNFWYWWVKKRLGASAEAEDADRYAKEWDIVADAAGAYKHWSGEKQFPRAASTVLHLLSMSSSTRDDFIVRQAHDYFQPSCFVHCS